MYIKNLTILNFRSIKDVSIDFERLVALIGPNSAGKTNILRAIDLIIGEGWTTKAKVARELFNNINNPIIIEIEFDAPINFTNKKGYRVSVETIRLELRYLPELNAKTTINNNQTFYDQDQFKKLCHFIYIPSERQLSSELRVSQWTMLGKLMRIVYDSYVGFYDNDPEKLRIDFEKAINSAKEFLERDFKTEAQLFSFKRFAETFKKYCLANSCGLATGFEPVLNIYNLNWFYKTLQIQVKEESNGLNFDSEEVGAGMKNLLMLSIFQTYAELMGATVVFGIEEPEIYLYPNAQRSLYSTFKELSKRTQIIYTTHNPNFIDASRPEDITILRKTKEKGTTCLEKSKVFNTEVAKKEFYRIYTHFNPERNEIFFAKKVVLVEGESDKILFSTLAKDRWEIDVDNKGIVIISCGGKGGVIYFVGVCKLIGLEDYFAVWDADDSVEDKHDLLKKALSTGKGIEFKPNLEAELGLPTGDDAQKVQNAHRWAKSIGMDKIPDRFNTLKLFLDESKKAECKESLDVERLEIELEPPSS